jgi:hypothetical protein
VIGRLSELGWLAIPKKTSRFSSLETFWLSGEDMKKSPYNRWWASDEPPGQAGLALLATLVLAGIFAIAATFFGLIFGQ